MSLDVCLERKKRVSFDQGKSYKEEIYELYQANITHNLGEMASKAGLYEALWRPYRLRLNYTKELEADSKKEWEFEDSQTILAEELIPVIEKGLAKLKAKPAYYKKYDSPNGWGLYEHFVPFVKEYLKACKQFPKSVVKVSR